MKKSSLLSPLWCCLSSPMSMLLLLLLNFVVNNVNIAHAIDAPAVCDESTHRCFHGGECMTSILVNNGETIQACDCTNAINNSGTKYIGLHCETDVSNANDDTRICSNESGNSGLFCLNDGVCPDDPNDPNGCSCTDEYTGMNCELKRNSDIIQNLSQNTGECSLVCQNDGKCQFGMLPEYMEGEINNDKNASNNKRKDDKGEFFYQHCRCQEGYYGLNCEKEHEICGNNKSSSQNDDDSNYCHHGSTCIDLGEKGQQQYACDCSTAIFQKVAFAGKYCNIQSTSICSDGNNSLNGHQFCTNYGGCIHEGKGIFHCSCSNGYKGDHCEYAPDQPTPIPEDEECTLTVCQNGGKCRFGKKNHGPAITQILSTPNGKTALAHILMSGNEKFEHCVCPPGFAGTLCEHEAQVCPDGKHVCFNGSECVKKSKNNEDRNDDDSLRFRRNIMEEDDDDEYGCSCNGDEKNLDQADDDDSLRRFRRNNMKEKSGGKYCQSNVDEDSEGKKLEYISDQNKNNKDDDKKEVDHPNGGDNGSTASSSKAVSLSANDDGAHHHRSTAKIFFACFGIVLAVISLVIFNTILHNSKNGMYEEDLTDDDLLKGRSRRLSFLKEQQELHQHRLQTNHYPTIPRTIFETVDISSSSRSNSITSVGSQKKKIRKPMIEDLM